MITTHNPEGYRAVGRVRLIKSYHGSLPGGRPQTEAMAEYRRRCCQHLRRQLARGGV